MIRLVAAVLATLTLALPARAALDIGERAPDFATAAARAGQVFDYSLAEALRHGPVVLYFFPAAYRKAARWRRTRSPRPFAQFEALGATVVGVSGDDIDTLAKFSVQACQGRFPVAADAAQSVMRSYDAVLKTRPSTPTASPTSSHPDGAIVFHYMSLNPTQHVEKMLAALRDWRATHR